MLVGWCLVIDSCDLLCKYTDRPAILIVIPIPYRMLSETLDITDWAEEVPTRLAAPMR